MGQSLLVPHVVAVPGSLPFSLLAFNLKYPGLVVLQSFSHFSQNKISNNDRCKKSLDARHIFSQRKGGSVPQHPCAQCLHKNFSRWRSSLQHQVTSDSQQVFWFGVLCLLHLWTPVTIYHSCQRDKRKYAAQGPLPEGIII